jgi:hypothetical protein
VAGDGVQWQREQRQGQQQADVDDHNAVPGNRGLLEACMTAAT